VNPFSSASAHLPESADGLTYTAFWSAFPRPRCSSLVAPLESDGPDVARTSLTPRARPDAAERATGKGGRPGVRACVVSIRPPHAHPPLTCVRAPRFWFVSRLFWPKSEAPSNEREVAKRERAGRVFPAQLCLRCCPPLLRSRNHQHAAGTTLASWSVNSVVTEIGQPFFFANSFEEEHFASDVVL
jgi:hypothetical protein